MKLQKHICLVLLLFSYTTPVLPEPGWGEWVLHSSVKLIGGFVAGLITRALYEGLPSQAKREERAQLAKQVLITQKEQANAALAQAIKTTEESCARNPQDPTCQYLVLQKETLARDSERTLALRNELHVATNRG